MQAIRDWFSSSFPFPLLFIAGVILAIIAVLIYTIWAHRPRPRSLEWIHLSEKPPFRFFGGRFKLDRWDAFIMAAFILVWGFVSLYNLGDKEGIDSFHVFSGETIEIDLGEETELGRVFYFAGLNTGEYRLSFSADGVNWRSQGEMRQEFSDVFRWREAELLDTYPTRFVHLSATRNLHLGEIAFYTVEGRRLPAERFSVYISGVRQNALALFDEQDLIPAHYTFRNSSIFDEVHHVRTAEEHRLGMWPVHEISHPPLGKTFISLGIEVFGLNPFGWRIVGTTMGVLMLALFYGMTKNLFGKRLVAFAATMIFASDFMRFTQTRIATIDTYAVFFIILMFWAMYRFISLDYDSSWKRALLPLGLCGLFFGLGAASKWTAIYFAPVLLILFVIYLVLRGKHWISIGERRSFYAYLGIIGAFCVLFFFIIPAVIYYLSYLPYGNAQGYSLWSLDYWRMVWDNQVFMFTYHADTVLGATHPFSSVWWQWILNIRPILYYRGIVPYGYRAVIASFHNPVLVWGGLLAILSLPFFAINRRDGRALAIFLGWFILLAPWFFITRLAFAYHYFTNTIFLALAIAYIFNYLIERKQRGYALVIWGITGLAFFLFVVFYPVLSGMTVPAQYVEQILRWFPSWPL